MNLPKPIKFEVERYVGGLSQFKKIENPIKLSANESALGASLKAIEAFETIQWRLNARRVPVAHTTKQT